MEPVEAPTDSGACGADGLAGAPSGPDLQAPNEVVAPVRGAPSHALGHSGHRRRWRAVAALCGVTASAAAVIIGAVMLSQPPPAGRSDDGARSDRVMAQHITVSQRLQTPLPLSDPQIAGLLTRRPDLGPLSDARRRGSCLRGLGYPSAARVLGARSLELDGRPVVVLVLPGAAQDAVSAYVVDSDCSSTRTGLLAQTVVSRP
jgi:hypothetical protein